MFNNISHCQRCGTCCKKGGPALHETDRHLLLSGHIGYHQLTTIRKDEPAFSPLSGKIEHVPREFIKVSGRGKTWVCCLFDETGPSCSIYENRPLECRLLKCWDTADLVSVIGKDSLTRFDLIDPENPLLDIIRSHEEECSVLKVEALISALLKNPGSTEILAELEKLVCNDLIMRSRAVAEFGLTLPVELFFFGRPLFKHLGVRGISVQQDNGTIRISFKSSLTAQP